LGFNRRCASESESLHAHSSGSLRAPVRPRWELPIAEVFLLAALAEMASNTAWMALALIGKPSRYFLRPELLTKLVCRANPPVWSCRVGRLPAMQLDGTVDSSKESWLHGPSFQPPRSHWLLIEMQSWYHVDSGKRPSQDGSQTPDVRAQCGVACGVKPCVTRQYQAAVYFYTRFTEG
jgi:hypothetical protein